MKKWGLRLFIVCFFMMCMIPSVGVLFSPKATAVGNEHLAAKPSLRKADGSLNLNILKEASDYFSDRIALRHEMITANSALTASLFNTLTNEDVLLGSDGWLFYTETLDDYTGINLMSERECWAAARSLYLMREYAKGFNARFLFTIAPNKNSLYPEHMPSRYHASKSVGNAERIFAALTELDVPFVDLFRVLGGEAETLYFKADSHWNNRGAALAGDYMCGAMGFHDEGFYNSDYAMEPTRSGDLYLMAYPSGKFLENDAIFSRPFTFSYKEGFRSPEDLRIYTVNEGKPGNLVMFRDSFGNALHPFMAERFGNAFFSRAVPYDLTAIERENGDTLVIELVERNLERLVSAPPIMPAPARTINVIPENSTGSAQVKAEACDKPDGYIKLSGNLRCGAIDNNSPIYVKLGNKIYEATPAGDGEYPFTLYVPASTELSGGEAIVCIDERFTTLTLEWE